MLQFRKLLPQQVEVYGVGMIEVDLLAVLQQGNVAVVPVIGILRDNDDLSLAEMLSDLLHNGSLP